MQGENKKISTEVSTMPTHNSNRLQRGQELQHLRGSLRFSIGWHYNGNSRTSAFLRVCVCVCVCEADLAGERSSFLGVRDKNMKCPLLAVIACVLLSSFLQHKVYSFCSQKHRQFE